MGTMVNSKIAVALLVALTGAVGVWFAQSSLVDDAGFTGEISSCLIAEQGMVDVPGGTFLMGSDEGYLEEGPTRKVAVNDFSISATEVTNRQFAKFVEDTGYKTVAERTPDPALYPDILSHLLTAGSAVFLMPWSKEVSVSGKWAFVEGANWRHPAGPDSSIEGLDDYPVVHIAYADAEAFARWQGHRLPTEAEFEYMARARVQGSKYAWGDDFTPQGTHQANTWQGLFPFQNAATDGYSGLAPVGCFAANAQGVYDAIGNVWEWTSSTYYPTHDVPDEAPTEGYDPNQPGVSVGVIKGGSYLCSPNFCMRYRPPARHPQDKGMGSNHIGFRTVATH